MSSEDRHFATAVLDWYDVHGRKSLPWQLDKTPYRVWVSEIMLQQTQVATVVPYYQRFMTRFPTVQELATADQDEVLHYWTGLGYYARGRNLHRAAQLVVAQHGGEFPSTVEALSELPGIGRSTAGAIAAIAFGRRAPILDGNVRRVLARHRAVAGTGAAVDTRLWELAERLTPTARAADYTQAIMDLGATLCRRSSPDCLRCPLANSCIGYAEGDPSRYPTRRVRQQKPTKTAKVFVLVDAADAMWLEKRPQPGIWGGLWSPPERPATTTTEEFLSEWQIDPADIRTRHDPPPVRHTFSHFHLDLSPVVLRLAMRPTLTAEPDRWLWYHPSDNARLGLTAVAVKLQASLQTEFSLT